MLFSEEVRSAVLALEDSNGHINPEDLIKAARKKSSPLHPCFLWDDQEAGNAHRLLRAKDLIRHMHVEISVEEITMETPAYIAIVEEVGYVSITKVAAESREAAMRRELVMLRGFVNRVMGISATWGNAPMMKKMKSFATWLNGQIE